MDQTTPTYIEDNNTTSHDCRNFQNAHYRYYFQADYAIDAQKVALKDGEETSGSYIDPTKQVRLAYTELVLNNTTGIDDIVVDSPQEDAQTDAPVIYYNLQGVRVDNPASGVYIRVQGDKVSKELIRR